LGCCNARSATWTDGKIVSLRLASLEEKTGAFEALAALIERLVRPPEAAVADLARARSKRRR
jgi:hypothetical protein